MSLSMHEQRVLGEIESRLAADDPTLVAVFRRFGLRHSQLATREAAARILAADAPGERRRPAAVAPRPITRPSLAPLVVLAVGVAVLALGFALGAPSIAMSGGVLAVTAPLLAMPGDLARWRLRLRQWTRRRRAG